MKNSGGNLLTGDPHSFLQTNGATVKHLELALEVNFVEQTLNGWAEWTLNPNKSDTLILDTRDLKINAVYLNNNSGPATFSMGKNDPVLGQALIIPINRHTQKVKIIYKTSAHAAALQWLKPSQTKGKQLPFLYTQSQAILARSWIPCMDSPGIKFTYNAKIKVPANLMALMSAENDTILHSNGVYHFSMPYPIPSYLMALTVGNLQYKSLGKNCGVYSEPETIKEAAFEFTDMEKMVNAASSLYGPYAWGKYDVVVMPPSFPFGGMENPRLTFATPTIITHDRSLVALIAHELAHSWSGNLVTNKTWDDFWLNEGFTVYFENRIMEALYGKEYADMHEVIGYGELKKTLKEMGENNPNTALKQNLKGMDPDDAVNDIAYEKGRFFLLYLERKVGRAQWDAFLKEYFNHYRFQSISTEEFLQFLNEKLVDKNKESASKINLNEWINAPGLPASFPVITSNLLDDAKQLAVTFSEGKPLRTASTSKWHTFQWLHFLRNLPEKLSSAQLAGLDQAFHFTNSNNAEILCDWFQLAIRNNYKPAYPAMENFLNTVGRRKFIQPLYALMKATGQTETALKIYKNAKPGYHQVSSHTIDQILVSE
ncbi:MAG: M1 family metallopeptidase [Bacteroidia bacterium]|nr:M1 family metallopeptidase [Bacteroidia bacterium]